MDVRFLYDESFLVYILIVNQYDFLARVLASWMCAEIWLYCDVWASQVRMHIRDFLERREYMWPTFAGRHRHSLSPSSSSSLSVARS